MPGRGDPVRARTQAVRPADRRVPAHAGKARRHVHHVLRVPGVRVRGGPGAGPQRNHAQGCRRSDPLRGGEGDVDGGRSDPGARWHGLHQRDADRPPVARLQALRDRRGNFRNPSLADRPRAVRGNPVSLRTPLSEKLGLRLPIIQAPMAGGPSSQELVAACSAAGALGCFGFAYTQPEDMAKQAAWVRAKTSAPFLVNLFASPQPGEISPTAQRAAIEAVARYYAEYGMPIPDPVKPPYAPDFDAQLAAVERIRPRAFTSHLAGVPQGWLKKFQAAGVVIGGSATNIAEAKE